MSVKVPVWRLIPGNRKGRHYMSQAQNGATCSGWACPSQDHSQTLALWQTSLDGVRLSVKVILSHAWWLLVAALLASFLWVGGGAPPPTHRKLAEPGKASPRRLFWSLAMWQNA